MAREKSRKKAPKQSRRGGTRKSGGKPPHSASRFTSRAKPRLARAAPAAKGASPERVRAILEKLDEAYPAATCALHHENPFQLLISTILSAQCTDERVNQVTATLFPKYAG